MSFVNKITVVLKATSDDENPTAGYLYKEISDISFESSGYCHSLVEFLVDRLKNKSCHVKFKVLKLMKHVSENGSKEFQIGLRKHSDVIKECTKFGGPPHPIHGNMPYLMVRKVAKELCESLYNMEQLTPRSPTESAEVEKPMEPKYGGLGPVRTGGAIQGFGNTPVNQSKGLGETILDSIEKLGAKMSETTADRQAALLAKLDLSGSTINYQPPVIMSDPSLTASAPVEELKTTLSTSMRLPVKKHQPGKAGGGWGDDEDDYEGEENANNNDNGSKQFSIETDSLTDPSNSRLQVEESQMDWKEEAELVAETIRRGSTGTEKVCLSPSAIKVFLTKCSVLSCDKVVEILAQRLASRDAGVILRTLQLLEGIIYNKEELMSIDHLAVTCKEPLVSCYLTSQANFQSKTPSMTSSEVCSGVSEACPGIKCGSPDGEVELDNEKIGTWKLVEAKSAKTVLILQQLSSQKEILPTSYFSHFLPSTSVSSGASGEVPSA